MHLQRLIAPVFGLALLSIGQANAAQVGAQLNVRLSIIKSCQVTTQYSSNAYLVSRRGCDTSAFQLQDERGQPLSAALGVKDSITHVEVSATSGSRIVVYW